MNFEAYLYSSKLVLDVSFVSAFLDVLNRYEVSKPSAWGAADERTRSPLPGVERIVRSFGDEPYTGATPAYFYSKKSPNGYIALKSGDPLGITIDVEHADGHLEQWFEIFAELCDIFVVDFASTDNWRIKDNQANTAYKSAGRLSTSRPPVYRTSGPSGLGGQTVLGKHYVDLFGRDTLENLPIEAENYGTDGLRLSLTEEPWNLSPDEYLKKWTEVMDLLAPSEVFSTEVRFDRYRKGKRGGRPP